MAKKRLKNGNWTICPANDGSELNIMESLGLWILITTAIFMEGLGGTLVPA